MNANPMPKLEDGDGRRPAPRSAAPCGPDPWRQRIRRWMAATLPRGWFMVSGRPGIGSVCLTFDDGPHPEHTPRLLDMLKAHGVRATFFVIGKNAERHPDLVRRMAAEGHDVGHHTFNHTEPAATSARQLMSEVRRTRELLRGLTGKSPRLFRPPHGKVTASKLLGLWGAGQRIILWNQDPKDFACRSAEELRGKMERTPWNGGDVVLLHDNVPHAAEALPGVIEATRRRGLEFATVEEWIGSRRAGVPAGQGELA